LAGLAVKVAGANKLIAKEPTVGLASLPPESGVEPVKVTPPMGTNIVFWGGASTDLSGCNSVIVIDPSVGYLTISRPRVGASP
jgi:hypothetical protein